MTRLALPVLLVGIALAWWGVAQHHPAASVPGILLVVVGLVLWRMRSWRRKEQVLRRVGLDLHVPPDET